MSAAVGCAAWQAAGPSCLDVSYEYLEYGLWRGACGDHLCVPTSMWREVGWVGAATEVWYLGTHGSALSSLWEGLTLQC